MKFFHLLHQRDTLLRAAHLSNLAYAYQRLGDFASRVAQARLQGEVHLQFADPAADRLWPVLTADTSTRSVIEEHFLEEDVVELADIMSFLQGEERQSGITFRFEDLEGRFLPELRAALEKAGVSLDHEEPQIEDSSRGQL